MLGLKNLAILPSYFDCIFVHLRQKSASQARIKPEIFVNFRPESGPNPTRKAQPYLQLWVAFAVADRVFKRLSGLDTKQLKKRYQPYTSRFLDMNAKLSK